MLSTIRAEGSDPLSFRPRQAAALERSALAMAGAAPLETLTARATDQLRRVGDFLTQQAPTTAQAVRLQKKGYQ